MISFKFNCGLLFGVVLIYNLELIEATIGEDHLGCFSSKYVESHPYYKIEGPLSWTQGLEACSHRLTTHMAVAPVNRYYTRNNYKVYCGNNLVENSESEAPSKCQKCGDKFCGGPNTVSIYKLRDATPFSVLLALSGSAIIKVTEEDELPVLDTIIKLDTKMWDMNYFYSGDEVWYSYHNNTYRSVYNPVTSRYSSPKKIPSCESNNQSPTVDWVKNTVYYGCAMDRKIYELDMNGTELRTYNPKLENNIKIVAFDPYRRMAFIVTSGARIFSYSLENGTLTEFLKFGDLMLKGDDICIDHHEPSLYIVGKLEGETDNALVKVDYQNTKADVLYRGPELYNVWNLDYFNGTIVWSNVRANDSLDIAYKCTLNPKCQRENLHVFYNDERQSITDLKIYHPLKQTPGPGVLCESLQCSHTCKDVSLFEARCECPAPLRLSVDKKTCTVAEALTLSANVPEVDVAIALEQVHLGCFSSQFAKSHPYYMIKFSLTFNQGAKMCSHRLTTHMAVTPDPSSPGEYTVFCGNDLLEHSETVDESGCQRCSEDEERYCGGAGAVSIYQLRESTPLSVVVAMSGTAIVKFTQENGGWRKNTLIPLSTKMWDMNYYYEEDEIWFSYKNKTYRTIYNPTASKFMTPRTVTFSCSSDNRSPVFDWVRHRVYYACAEEKNIYELDLNGNYLKMYEPKIYRLIRDIAVDPYRRLAFINTFGHKIFSYSLDSGKLKEFVQFGKYFVKPKTICLDHHAQDLYVVGELEGETDKAIVKVNYQNTEALIVYKGPELSNVWSMDHFNGTIVWSNVRASDNLDIAYMCPLTPTCNKENLKQITSNPKQSITNIKIYHPLKQTPDTQALCDEIKCHRYCTRFSLFEAKC